MNKDEIKNRQTRRNIEKSLIIKDKEKRFYELMKEQLNEYEKSGSFNIDFLKSFTNILD